MLDSNFLDSYGVYLIPLFFVLGYCAIQTGVVRKEVSYVGIILTLIAWAIYYDRAETFEDKDDHLLWATLLVLLSSAQLLYSEIRNGYVIISALLFAAAWAYMAWVLSENDLGEEKTQYILISVILIVLSVVYFIPRQRVVNNVFDIGLPMFAVGWAMLANTIADSPAKDLIIY